MYISSFTRKSKMINAVSVTAMLADRIAKKNSCRSSGNVHEQKLVDDTEVDEDDTLLTTYFLE